MINVVAIRNKIQQAIDKMPTVINLKRYSKVSDGMGGFAKASIPTNVATFNALLDNSSHGIITTQLTDSAVLNIEKTNKLYVVYDTNFIVLKDDFFIVNNIRYIIKNAVNILNMNIYYECDLEDVSANES